MTAQIEEIFQSLDVKKIDAYKTYWNSITPTTAVDYYNRWVFAFLSVHTTWQANVNSYLLLTQNAEAWLHSKEELINLLQRGKCGLYKRRSEGLWEFKYLYWENPEAWKKQANEDWLACRRRLEKRCNGLGYAKTAFALEMCYPTTCENVCLDTHMLQLYGYKSKDQAKVSHGPRYIQLENDWVGTAQEYNIPSYIARCLYWDMKQKKDDSRYWSYVFEKNNE
jgi:hypothetical protein